MRLLPQLGLLGLAVLLTLALGDLWPIIAWVVGQLGLAAWRLG